MITSMFPAEVHENLTIYSVIPPEAKQGWDLELYELAREVPFHAHDKYSQFILVVEGQMQACYGTESVLLSSGEHICIAPGVEHSLVPKGPVRFFSVNISGSTHSEDSPFIDPKYFGAKIDKGDYAAYELIPGASTGEKWSVAFLEIQDSPKHYHRIEKEVFFVVDGALDIEVDAISQIIKVGEFVAIVPERIHKLKSAEKKPVRVLCFSLPAFDPSDMYCLE